MPIDRSVCGHIKAWWDNHPKCLSCSSCSRLSSYSICNLWSKKIWNLADKTRLYSARRSTMKKKLTKKKKVVHSDVADDNTFLYGSTTPQGFTAMGKTHLGGNYSSTQSTSPPGTGHQAPVNFTRHRSTRHPATYHQSTRHWATMHQSTRHQATRHQATRHQSTRHRATSHCTSDTRHWSPVTGHSGTGHQAVITRHQSLVIQSPGTSHRAGNQSWAPVNLPGTGHQATNTLFFIHISVLSIH